MYKCYVCGKEFARPKEAAKCTLDCYAKQERVIADRKRKELAAAQADRRKEVLRAKQEYEKKLKEYSADYKNDPDFLANVEIFDLSPFAALFKL